MLEGTRWLKIRGGVHPSSTGEKVQCHGMYCILMSTTAGRYHVPSRERYGFLFFGVRLTEVDIQRPTENDCPRDEFVVRIWTFLRLLIFYIVVSVRISIFCGNMQYVTGLTLPVLLIGYPLVCFFIMSLVWSTSASPAIFGSVTRQRQKLLALEMHGDGPTDLGKEQPTRTVEVRFASSAVSFEFAQPVTSRDGLRGEKKKRPERNPVWTRRVFLM